MLITRNDDGLEARLNSSNKTLVVTFADDFEEGVTMIMLYDTEDNVLIKPMRFTLPIIENGGIATATDFKAFIDAVTSGSSLRKFKDTEGNVILLNDIDMKDITLTSGAGSNVTSNTTNANTKVVYTIGEQTFIIRKSKFPQNPKRSVRFSGKGTKRSVQKRKARNTQKAETKVL